MTNEQVPPKPPVINDPDSAGISQSIAEEFADMMHRLETAHRGNPDFPMLICGVMARAAMIAVLDNKFTTEQFHDRAYELYWRVNHDPVANERAKEILAHPPPLTSVPSVH